MQQSISNLTTFRSFVDTRTVGVVDVLEFYTNITVQCLKIVDYVAVTNDSTLSVKLMSVSSLLHMMDWGGVRRGIVNALLVNNSIQTGIVQYVAEANSKYKMYQELYLVYATPSERTLYFAQFGSNTSLIVPKLLVDTTVQDILSESFTSQYSTSKEWWDNNTILILSLQQLFVQVLKSSDDYIANVVKPQYRQKLGLFAIGFVLELIASIQLCWMAAPIFSFWITTTLSGSLESKSGSVKSTSSKLDSKT